VIKAFQRGRRAAKHAFFAPQEELEFSVQAALLGLPPKVDSAQEQRERQAVSVEHTPRHSLVAHLRKGETQNVEH